mmetsp:Transcript_37767/g.67690  ORF Transcript_37767/g.67690 Transcript_37767/m.67690 type:complete len:280 (+) Transcript_37767:101-940(+)
MYYCSHSGNPPVKCLTMGRPYTAFSRTAACCERWSPDPTTTTVTPPSASARAASRVSSFSGTCIAPGILLVSNSKELRTSSSTTAASRSACNARTSLALTSSKPASAEYGDAAVVCSPPTLDSEAPIDGTKPSSARSADGSRIQGSSRSSRMSSQSSASSSSYTTLYPRSRAACSTSDSGCSFSPPPLSLPSRTAAVCTRLCSTPTHRRTPPLIVAIFVHGAVKGFGAPVTGWRREDDGGVEVEDVRVMPRDDISCSPRHRSLNRKTFLLILRTTRIQR